MHMGISFLQAKSYMVITKIEHHKLLESQYCWIQPNARQSLLTPCNGQEMTPKTSLEKLQQNPKKNDRKSKNIDIYKSFISCLADGPLVEKPA